MKKYYNIPITDVIQVQGIYVMSDTSNVFSISDGEENAANAW